MPKRGEMGRGGNREDEWKREGTKNWKRWNWKRRVPKSGSQLSFDFDSSFHVCGQVAFQLLISVCRHTELNLPFNPFPALRVHSMSVPLLLIPSLGKERQRRENHHYWNQERKEEGADRTSVSKGEYCRKGMKWGSSRDWASCLFSCITCHLIHLFFFLSPVLLLSTFQGKLFPCT